MSTNATKRICRGNPGGEFPLESDNVNDSVITVMDGQLESWENSNYAKLPPETRRQIWLLLFIRDEGEDPDVKHIESDITPDYWGDASHYPHMKGKIYLVCKYLSEDHKAHMNFSVARDVK